jgi:hypothetical protein
MIPFLVLFGIAMQEPIQHHPPPILQIAREPLKPGREAAYRNVEEDTARQSAKLGCPHPYLGVESLSGPKEIWWFNGYAWPLLRETNGARQA